MASNVSISETVRADVAAFLDQINAAPAAASPDEVGPVAMREFMAGLSAMTDLPMRETAAVRDFQIPRDDGTRIQLRLFDHEPGRPDGPLVLFFHGGGFVLGDLDSYASICAEMAWSLGLPVVAVDYRLAPEHPWPAAPEDCETAAGFLAGSDSRVRENLEFSPTGLVLAGESAGGWLALVSALALQAVPALVPVLACNLWYPWVEPGVTTHDSYSQFGAGHVVTADALDWFERCFAMDTSHSHARSLCADYSGFPPTAIFSAGLDPLRDQGRDLARALTACGATALFREATGNVHGFLGLRGAIPSSTVDMSVGLADLRYLIANASPDYVALDCA